jgi:hypothetical protein
VVIFTIFVATDSFDNLSFNIKDSYVETFSILMTTAFTAYFAGRSYEKVRLNRK